MPTVPVAVRTQTDAGQLPGPRISSDVSPQGFGEGVGRLTSGMTLAVIEDQRLKADDMAVMAVSNDMKKYSTALLYDPQNGMLAKHGKEIYRAARENGLSYSEFMAGLKRAEIEVDRKVLAELAVTDPKGFAAIAEKAQAARA